MISRAMNNRTPLPPELDPSEPDPTLEPANEVGTPSGGGDEGNDPQLPAAHEPRP
jgi:hypothetical protein